jgi:cystathionine gamma-lyase
LCASANSWWSYLNYASIFSSHLVIDIFLFLGLKSHPQHELASSQMHGFGGMVTIWVNGGESEARKFLESLKLFALAESLGAVECLAEYPYVFVTV